MKLSITPGPWISKGISIYSVSVCSWHILTVNPFAPERENSEANTTAIVTAVNNTYHKGINPEAVPEMLSALEALVKTSDLTNIPVGIVETLKQIIQKATLCPTTS